MSVELYLFLSWQLFKDVYVSMGTIWYVHVCVTNNALNQKFVLETIEVFPDIVKLSLSTEAVAQWKTERSPCIRKVRSLFGTDLSR